MVPFILHTIAFQLLFLLVYEWLLKKETFFQYNRAYLLITPIVALILPLLEFDFLQKVLPTQPVVMLPEILIGNGKEMAGEETGGALTTFNNLNWWLIIYTCGMLVGLGLLIYKIRILRQLFLNKKVLVKRNMKIVEIPHSKMACTFYNTIFIGTELSEKDRDQVISHEMVHVRQRHTLDLLFFEFLKIVFWFNPLVYLYQSRISECHEFLADAKAVKKVEKRTYFEQLLNAAFDTEEISFVNQFFNHSIIKKRIVMLQKSRSKSTSKFKFLIVLPLMLAMMTYVACSEEPAVKQEQQELSAQEKLEEIKAIIGDNSEISTADQQRIQEILGSIHTAELESEQRVAVSKMKGGSDVPFSVIEEVPVFPGCEALKSNEERKQCMSEKITQLVSKNFDTSLGKELGLSGLNRVYVQFRINKNGTIETLGVRAPHAALEEEGERVVNLLPSMTPGKQDGKAVGVIYTLPITFKVSEQ